MAFRLLRNQCTVNGSRDRLSATASVLYRELNQYGLAFFRLHNRHYGTGVGDDSDTFPFQMCGGEQLRYI